MADKTRIEWAANPDGTPGATWNPIRARDTVTGKIGTHCVHASDGCAHCYAEAHNRRGMTPGGTGLAYTKQNEARVEIFLNEKMLLKPLQIKKPTTFFLSSMTDVFADFVSDEIIDELLGVMQICPRHTFIVLTKRAARARKYFARLDERQRALECNAAVDWLNWPLPNVWLGVSVEDRFNVPRIWDLILTPAARRVISFEPLLEDVSLRLRDVWRPGDTLDGVTPCIDWVIVGGESGPGARPMHPQWARDLRDLFVPAGVPFFFKQWGAHTPIGIDDQGEALATPPMLRVGKAAAGRHLDGRTHDERPPFSHLKELAA